MNRQGKAIVALLVVCALFAGLYLGAVRQAQPIQMGVQAVIPPPVVTILPEQAITSTAGQSSATASRMWREATAYVSTTVTAGVVTYTIQHSPDNNTWVDHTTLSAVSATGTASQALANFGPYVRVSYEVEAATDVTSTVWLSLKE